MKKNYGSTPLQIDTISKIKELLERQNEKVVNQPEVKVEPPVKVERKKLKPKVSVDAFAYDPFKISAMTYSVPPAFKPDEGPAQIKLDDPKAALAEQSLIEDKNLDSEPISKRTRVRPLEEKKNKDKKTAKAKGTEQKIKKARIEDASNQTINTNQDGSGKWITRRFFR